MATLLNAANIRQDDQVLLLLNGQNPISKGIKYHRSCYKEFTKSETLAKIEADSSAMEDSLEVIYDNAYKEIDREVQREVIVKKNVVSIAKLTTQFVYHLNCNNVNISDYRHSKLMLRLKKTFGNLLSFKQPSKMNESELIYYAQVESGDRLALTISQDLIHCVSKGRIKT